jgi:Cu+-exporting ATPase
MGTGTDIAVEAGDVILMRGDLAALPRAIALSRSALSTIRQNFFWAYAYNVALVPLAAGALYPLTGMMLSPVIAALAMSASSLFVVGNSLRLRRFR